MIEGIDVSHFQGQVDWKTVGESGIRFAICRAGEALYSPDVTFGVNARGAAEQNIYVGSYFVFHPDVSTTRQAIHYKTIVGSSPISFPPAVDIEVRGGISPQKFVPLLDEMIQATEDAFGRKCLLYTYPSFAQEMIPHADELLSRSLWIAHYEVEKPTIPYPWTDWTIWQYVGNKGHVPGVYTACDRDRFNGTEDDLQQWAASVG